MPREHQKKQQKVEEVEAEREVQRKEQRKRQVIIDPEEESKTTNRIRRNKPKLFLFSFYFSEIFIFNHVFYTIYVLCMNFVTYDT